MMTEIYRQKAPVLSAVELSTLEMEVEVMLATTEEQKFHFSVTVLPVPVKLDNVLPSKMLCFPRIHSKNTHLNCLN